VAAIFFIPFVQWQQTQYIDRPLVLQRMKKRAGQRRLKRSARLIGYKADSRRENAGDRQSPVYLINIYSTRQ
jgi:hypothetical protein